MGCTSSRAMLEQLESAVPQTAALQGVLQRAETAYEENGLPTSAPQPAPQYSQNIQDSPQSQFGLPNLSQSPASTPNMQPNGYFNANGSGSVPGSPTGTTMISSSPPTTPTFQSRQNSIWGGARQGGPYLPRGNTSAEFKSMLSTAGSAMKSALTPAPDPRLFDAQLYQQQLTTLTVEDLKSELYKRRSDLTQASFSVGASVVLPPSNSSSSQQQFALLSQAQQMRLKIEMLRIQVALLEAEFPRRGLAVPERRKEDAIKGAGLGAMKVGLKSGLVSNVMKGTLGVNITNPLANVTNPLANMQNPLAGMHNPLANVNNPLNNVNNPLNSMNVNPNMYNPAANFNLPPGGLAALGVNLPQNSGANANMPLGFGGPGATPFNAGAGMSGAGGTGGLNSLTPQAQTMILNMLAAGLDPNQIAAKIAAGASNIPADASNIGDAIAQDASNIGNDIANFDPSQIANTIETDTSNAFNTVSADASAFVANPGQAIDNAAYDVGSGVDAVGERIDALVSEGVNDLDPSTFSPNFNPNTNALPSADGGAFPQGPPLDNNIYGLGDVGVSSNGGSSGNSFSLNTTNSGGNGSSSGSGSGSGLHLPDVHLSQLAPLLPGKEGPQPLGFHEQGVGSAVTHEAHQGGQRPQIRPEQQQQQHTQHQQNAQQQHAQQQYLLEQRRYAQQQQYAQQQHQQQQHAQQQHQQQQHAQQQHQARPPQGSPQQSQHHHHHHQQQQQGHAPSQQPQGHAHQHQHQSQPQSQSHSYKPPSTPPSNNYYPSADANAHTQQPSSRPSSSPSSSHYSSSTGPMLPDFQTSRITTNGSPSQDFPRPHISTSPPSYASGSTTPPSLLSPSISSPASEPSTPPLRTPTNGDLPGQGNFAGVGITSMRGGNVKGEASLDSSVAQFQGKEGRLGRVASVDSELAYMNEADQYQQQQQQHWQQQSVSSRNGRRAATGDAF